MRLHSTSQSCSRPTGSANRRRHAYSKRLPVSLVLVSVPAWPSAAWAAASEAGSGFDFFRQPASLVLVLGLATLVPFAFMALTAFVKISTVLQIVKGAIGVQSVPSNSIVVALAAALTLLAMAPVGTRIVDQATPLMARGVAPDSVKAVQELWHAVGDPMRDFLRSNASTKEKQRFFELAKQARPSAQQAQVAANDWVVLVPAFVVTELLEAFALGFLIYLPFLVIDLVISNVLIALGMQMMTPSQVSLPFKLLLFVAIDGWGLIAQALVTGYHVS
jgi:type III secretion protein R